MQTPACLPLWSGHGELGRGRWAACVPHGLSSACVPCTSIPRGAGAGLRHPRPGGSPGACGHWRFSCFCCCSGAREGLLSLPPVWRPHAGQAPACSGPRSWVLALPGQPLLPQVPFSVPCAGSWSVSGSRGVRAALLRQGVGVEEGVSWRHSLLLAPPEPPVLRFLSLWRVCVTGRLSLGPPHRLAGFHGC